MNPDVKKKWLAALRSGEYKKAKRRLRYGDHYCCLGILCDLYRQETPGVTWDKISENRFVFHGVKEKEAIYLPKEVQTWAGLTSRNPKVRDEQSLAMYNDREYQEYSFVMIANIIEDKL